MSQRIQNTDSRIKTLNDLIVWRRARELTVLIYGLTKTLPSSERYGMVPQMRRSAISVSSNIAEGFGRWQAKDKDHFYVMAAGSLSELFSQLVTAKDLGYISDDEFRPTNNKLTETRKLLAALLARHRS